MEVNQNMFALLPPELSARILYEAQNPYTTLVSKDFNYITDIANKYAVNEILEKIKTYLPSPGNLRIVNKVRKKSASLNGTELINFLYKKLLNAANKKFTPIRSPESNFSTKILEVAFEALEQEHVHNENLEKIWSALKKTLYLHCDGINTPDEIRLWLDENILLVQSIDSLNLSCIELTCLPREICRFSGLEHLNLSANNLVVLPSYIGKLSNLKSLYIDDNNISQLPNEIGDLKALQLLRCTGNNLTALPETIGKLSNLYKLFLSNNKIAILPSSIGELSFLQELFLGNNKLTVLPETIGMLSNLLMLGLDQNLLEILPSEIGYLFSLTTLFLNDNRLCLLPREIGNLSLLQRLWIQNNEFVILPDEEIANLPMLTELKK